jgi:hypothetical protein
MGLTNNVKKQPNPQIKATALNVAVLYKLLVLVVKVNCSLNVVK